MTQVHRNSDVTCICFLPVYLYLVHNNFCFFISDDMELGRQENPGTPNLKKSRSLGGSLKKLFRRSRKRSQGREDQEMSRESSLSRSSARNISKGPSRETSLTRTGQSSRESAIS